MPELLASATPFSTEDLRQIDLSLPLSVMEWAEASYFIRQPGMDNWRIRDIATFHALYKAQLARGRLSSFREAVAAGLDLHTLNEGPLLHSHSPKGMAGKAAGQMAVAKLLTRWYDLQPKNFLAIAARPEARDAILRGVEGVQEAVCIAPRDLGITNLIDHDVFLEAQREVEDAVSAHGPEALEPYITFPEYPIE